MKKIYGYVLVKETNSGVPNLVVTAFDSEKSIREIFTVSDNEQQISLHNLGKRIGSVLTDAQGKFVLTTEDLEFQGNESRPDLLLAIFAPEDIYDPVKPYPKSPEERLLYISTVPREDSGAEEAFLIRLLQTRIDHFKIPTSSSSKQNYSNQFANAVENTWESRDNLKNRLKKRLQKESDESKKRTDDARKQVENLSGIPFHLRDKVDEKGKKIPNTLRNNDFLIIGKKELHQKLPDMQTKVVEEALKRLDKSENKPKLRLHLTEKDLNDIGLKLEKGRIIGEVNSKKFREKMKTQMKSVDLIKVRGLNNPSPDELEKKYLSGEAKNMTDSTNKPIG